MGKGSTSIAQNINPYSLSPFYAAESCMNFSQPNTMPSTSQDSGTESSIITSNFHSMENSTNKNDVNLGSKDTLESLLQSSFINIANIDFSNPNKTTPQGKLPLMLMKIKPAIKEKHTSSNFEEHQNQTEEKQSSRVAISCGNRVKWTQELHERFVECVNHLGGAKKATPKGIRMLMKTDGLTILQVKSHLQKYRTSKGIPESTEERKVCRSLTPQLDTNREIVEAIMVQVDVQKRLNEQLELQIEEQRKQLKMMSDMLKAN